MAVRPSEILTAQPESGAFNVHRSPTWLETLSDTAGTYIAGPATASARMVAYEDDPNYVGRENIPEGYELEASYFFNSGSPEETEAIKSFVDQSRARRQRLNRAPFMQQISTEIVNPVNLLALPVAPVRAATGAVRIGQTMLRSGGAAAAVEAGLQAGVLATDPASSFEESAFSVASVYAFGSALSGLTLIPLARRQAATEQMRTQHETMQRVAARLDGVQNIPRSNLEDFAPAESRPLGADEGVVERYQELQGLIDERQRMLADPNTDADFVARIEDEIEQFRTEQQAYSQELMMRALEDEGFDLSDPLRPSDGVNNWAFDWVTNPMRRALGRALPTSVKRQFLELAGDGGVQLRVHEMGVALPHSVHQAATTEMGNFLRMSDALDALWREDTGAPPVGTLMGNRNFNATDIARRMQRTGDTLEDWVTRISEARVMQENLTGPQAQAVKILDQYMLDYEQRLSDSGLLMNNKILDDRIEKLEAEMDALQARIDNPQSRADVRAAERQFYSARRELQEYRIAREQGSRAIDRIEPMFPRYWNKQAVRQNREELREVLVNWFRRNPEVWEYDKPSRGYVKRQLNVDEGSLRARAERTIDNILEENQFNEGAEVFTGSGRAGHTGFRKLDIPNSLVWKFMEQNPIAVMRNYTARTAPQIQFAKQFGGNIEAVKERMRAQMDAEGVPLRQQQATIRDFQHLYDRVVGVVLKNPDTLDQKIAAVLRELTSTTYLGAAGVAAIGDMGRIAMEHEMPTLVKSLQGMMDPAIRRLSSDEIRWLGGASEMANGSAMLRVVDDQNFNYLQGRAMDRARNIFHTVNLLGPVTVVAKHFAGSVGGHALIDYSRKLAQGVASQFEITYLARHGIDEAMARRIASAPWQRDPKSDLILPNTDAWSRQPALQTRRGDRVDVLDELPEEGDLVQFNPETNTLVMDRQAVMDEFPERPWTVPSRVTNNRNVRRRVIMDRFDEQPWTEAPYNLRPDDIQTPEQFENFLALYESRLFQDETFLNQQRSLFALSEEEMLREVQQQYKVDRIITDPEIVRNVFDRQAEGGANPNPLGRHIYFEGEGGTVYLNFPKMREFWESFRQFAEGKTSQEMMASLRAGYEDGFIPQINLIHRVNLVQNKQLLENFNDFAEFVLFHELNHGPNGGRPWDYSTTTELEEMVDRAGMRDLNRRQAERAKADAVARRYSLEASNGGALPENAFETPDDWANFRAMEAIVEADPIFSNRSLGLDGRRNADRSLRRVAIQRETMRRLREAVRDNDDLVNTFRRALNTNVNNVVMAATAADKPIIMDGVVYLRTDNPLARLMGLEENKATPGYARIENGFLALPLQFFSFTLANVNKTMGQMMQGAVRNRLAGVVAMMGLGYMISAARTPDYVWNDMAPQDKFARAFDMSGIAALYSDLFYTGMQTSLALGGPNITGGVFQPRYPQDPNIPDAITNVTGAASSWSLDMYRSMEQFAQGNYGEGASQFIRNLPFSNVWFIRDDVNQLGRYLSQ